MDSKQNHVFLAFKEDTELAAFTIQINWKKYLVDKAIKLKEQSSSSPSFLVLRKSGQLLNDFIDDFTKLEELLLAEGVPFKIEMYVH